MAGKISFLIAILFVLMITGCGGDKSSSAFSSKGGGVVRTDYSPSEPTSSDAITLKITAVAGEHPEYNWIVNGITVPVSGNKLDPEHFSKNDTVFCSILIGGEEKKKVGPIVIKNSPPRINSLGISPDSPKHGIDLSINANVDDVDRDDVTFLVKWFVNEEEVGSGEALSGSEIKAADQVYAVVRPYDGTDEGLPMNSGFVLVQNSPPEFVSPPPSIEGRTMNYEIEVKDGDGDNFDLSLEQGPSGMRLEGNRLVWEAPELDKDTSVVIKIKARDERGGETNVSFSLDLRKREMQ
ncbi:hypothetical protein JW879_08440 [candidate division WOR-3 bacterium]|nr:hypothetical protein [candidate division WOR-3 bacterium]